MNIKIYQQFAKSSPNKYYWPIEEILKFEDLCSFLTGYFHILFDDEGNLNLDNFYNHEANHIYAYNDMRCGLDIKNKIIHIFTEADLLEYEESPNRSIIEDIKNDYSDLDLVLLEKVRSTTIPEDNFIELIQNWYKIWKGQTPFALLYQDEKDWIHCKAFDSEEEMDQFIKQHS